MSLVTPASVQKLQTALHAKAKEAPSFRFYALYDKVHRKDILTYAYECCKANGGAAGVDGQKLEDIEARREAAAVRSARYPGSDGGNGGSFGSRTYFRGRSAAGTVRLSARPQRVGRRQTCRQADLRWPSRNC